MRGCTADDGLDERIADHAGVAVLVRGDALHPRSDDEGRVGDDLVETLTAHGLEEAAEPELDVVDGIELRVEPRQLESALGDIRRHDGRRVASRMHRLDTAAGAEVKDAADRVLHHQPAQGHRCPADTENVLLTERAAEGEFAEV